MSMRSTGTTPGSRQTFGVGFVLFGLGLVVLARLLRPVPAEAPLLAALLVGVLPSFGAGLALPFVLDGVDELARRRAGRSWRLNFVFLCICTFLGLLAWEYAQRALWDIPFDWHDIIASGVGVAMALASHRWFLLRKERVRLQLENGT